ncbi:hypothetical protein M413DRAFT_440651 [Hebeloma cylindrosporum]|uniref:Uncharacterized protein n=1 Tax=Hebeloma cylindrosporum TaxID=76867 RepID=A0A0C3CST9_HEBCY|nr:hypothetical protein M413DRAFT_440651 [Hebeloma cylindrosporum h7]
MFSKIWTSAALVLALALQVTAHAAISPALGVAGTPVRNNVKRPNAKSPCGAGVNIANTIDTSTAVAANAAGSFKATAINFNGGRDGSRKVTAKVDATGKGTTFVAMTVTTNGDAAPANTGSQPIVASLPAGTKCTGGKTGNKCLVQFVTTAGFGNCMVVSQGAAVKQREIAAGSRAARSLLAELEARGEEAVAVVKRGITSWIWA